MERFPRLYALVDRVTLDARGVRVRAFATELLEGGVRLVQYRDKGNGAQEILRACTDIREVFEGVEAMLILNDRADLAALLGWGVHVGQGDLSVEDARRVLVPQGLKLGASTGDGNAKPEGLAFLEAAVIGVSTHTDEQVREAEAGTADYVAVGPVFGTRTKVDAEAVVGLEGVRRARRLTTKALVGIGGITLENARSVVEAGADSVAVISGLFVDGMAVRDVAAAFLALLSA